MAVEQTSQLIQLILNSVLMVTVCVIVLAALLTRHTASCNRLRLMNQEYFRLLSDAVVLRGDRLFQVKQQLLLFRKSYGLTYSSLVVVYGALVVFIASTFLLAVRTLINWSWLIPLSLASFVLGVGVLLMGIALSLMDFLQSRRSFWEEMNGVLGLGERFGGDIETDLRAPNSQVSQPRKRRSRRLLPSKGLLQYKTVSG